MSRGLIVAQLDRTNGCRDPARCPTTRRTTGGRSTAPPSAPGSASSSSATPTPPNFNSGVSIEVVRRRLGHASTETTQVYCSPTRSPTPRSAPHAADGAGQRADRPCAEQARRNRVYLVTAVLPDTRSGWEPSLATSSCISPPRSSRLTRSMPPTKPSTGTPAQSPQPRSRVPRPYASFRPVTGPARLLMIARIAGQSGRARSRQPARL